MAQIVSVSVYGLNGSSTGTAQGVTMGFPTQGILIRPAPASTTFNGVTMATMIQMLPSGTRVAQDQWFSPTALETVITSSNA